MSGVNKVILVGRLGKDPEVKDVNGVAVATFSIATSEKYKDKSTGEVKETTEWHNLVLWRGLADISSKYLHKGDMVYVEGKLKTRSWEKEGVKHYRTEVVADNMTMLGTKGSSAQSGNGAQEHTASSSQGAMVTPEVSEINIPAGSGADDLPF